MSGLNAEDRRSYLQAIQRLGDAGRAEGAPQQELARGFYPVAEHLRMLDPDVVLIVGPRGSGKTQIARVLTESKLYESVSKYAPAVRLPTGKAEWIKAFPMEREGFDLIGFRSFVNSTKGDPKALQEFWFAYLVRILSSLLDAKDRKSIAPLLSAASSDPVSIHKAFIALGTVPVAVLDRLDEQLEQKNTFFFVTYDELDTLGGAGADWALVDAGVGGLMSLWANYTRRWRHIRAKLFVRTDLYERNLHSGEADLAKLAAGRIELAWSDRDLYGLLLKRLSNGDTKLGEYIRGIRKTTWNEDPVLGFVPQLYTSQDARPIVERLIGVYMGANAKKGLVFRWLLDHVRDGRGRAYPRPFVRLIEEAARLELKDISAGTKQKLLEPSSIRQSLDSVSIEHVAQSYSEWPWLNNVVDLLKQNPLVPYGEKDIVKLLKGLAVGTSAMSPPFAGQELIDYLLELGIFRRRPDNRMDVPDLFLAGLGLKRKGGVVKG
ncbi:MAG TPA: hypothetical protein VMV90_04220 [Rectinemataceae bacterium]|nr:hypothetical protein [Rectinemataceae bacterium]